MKSPQPNSGTVHVDLGKLPSTLDIGLIGEGARARRHGQSERVAKNIIPVYVYVYVGTKLRTRYPAYKVQVKIKGETCKSHAPACD
jgi:hypothetical protein